jgi:hypothetical protein
MAYTVVTKPATTASGTTDSTPTQAQIDAQHASAEATKKQAEATEKLTKASKEAKEAEEAQAEATDHLSKGLQGILEDIKNVDSAKDESARKFKHLSASEIGDASKVGSAVVQGGLAFKGMGEFASASIGKVKALASQLKDFAAIASNIPGVKDVLSIKVGLALAPMDRSMGAMGEAAKQQGLFQSRTEQIDRAAEGMQAAGKALNIGLLSSMAGLSGKDAKTLADTEKKAGSSVALNMMKQMVALSDNAQYAKEHLMQQAAATGTLNSALVGGKYSAEQMTAVLQRQNIANQGLMVGTGMSLEQATRFNDMLSTQVPRTFGDATSGLTKSMEQVSFAGKDMLAGEAAYTAMRATGMKHSDILAMQTEATKNYNANAGQAIDYTLRISEASQRHGLALSDTSSVYSAFGQQLGWFGNQTEGTSKIVDTLGTALKNTGVSGEQVKTIMQDVAGAMGGLSTGKKAFLAQQAGMGGGMSGALKVERLLAEGKSGEVFDMMTKALKNLPGVGGKLMTRAESEKDEASAQRYIAQRQYLQQMMGLKSEGEVAKMMEAMAKGKDTGSAAIASQKDLQASVATIGAAKVAETETPLRQAAIGAEMLAADSAVAAAKSTDNLLAMANAATEARAALAGISTTLRNQSIKYSTKTVKGEFGPNDADASLDQARAAKFAIGGVERGVKAVSTLGDRLVGSGRNIIENHAEIADQKREAEQPGHDLGARAHILRKSNAATLASTTHKDIEAHRVARGATTHKDIEAHRAARGAMPVGAPSPVIAHSPATPTAGVGPIEAIPGSKRTTPTGPGAYAGVAGTSAQAGPTQNIAITTKVEGICIDCAKKITAPSQTNVLGTNR